MEPTSVDDVRVDCASDSDTVVTQRVSNGGLVSCQFGNFKMIFDFEKKKERKPFSLRLQ